MLYLDTKVLSEEEWERDDELDQVLVIDNGSLKCRFGDLFCGLQALDYIGAALYSGRHFEEALETPEKLSHFLFHLHSLAARHLVLKTRDENQRKAGEFTKTQPMIHEGGHTFTPTAVPLAEIPNQFRDFSVALLDRIKSIKSPGNAVAVAAFALGEMGRIHPFTNGNGRIGRILMNTILAYGSSVPINFEDKGQLYAMLKRYTISKDIAELKKAILLKTIARSKTLASEPPQYIEKTADFYATLNESLVVVFDEDSQQLVITNPQTQDALFMDDEGLPELIGDQTNTRVRDFLGGVNIQGYREAHLEDQKHVACVRGMGAAHQ